MPYGTFAAFYHTSDGGCSTPYCKRQPSKAPSKGHNPAIQAAPATPSKRSIV